MHMVVETGRPYWEARMTVIARQRKRKKSVFFEKRKLNIKKLFKLTRSKFHRETTGRRVKGHLGTENPHDVVTVSCETDDEEGSSGDKLPDGNFRRLGRNGTG